MAKWTPKRGAKLAIRQYALLAAAWQALKPGGYVLYSTCSINPKENDGVIAKLINRKKEEVEKLESPLEVENLERTEYGYILLPDRAKAGPIYFSLLQKLVSEWDKFSSKLSQWQLTIHCQKDLRSAKN